MIYDIIAGQSKSIPIAVWNSTPLSVGGAYMFLAKSAPVIASTDFLISINGGAWQALANTPTVTPSGGDQIVVTFSAVETTAAGAGGYITLRAYDVDQASGWLGGLWWFPVVSAATSTLTAAQVNTEADTALADVGLTTTITGRIDQAISSRATPTNITAGTITTVTNLTNAPTNGDLTATMKASVTTAATAATPTGVGLADGAITAAKIATDAITAAKVAADVTTEIQAGLATAANVTSAQTSITNAIGALNNLTAAQVWEYGTRTLSSFGTLIADVWAYATRTLTSFGSLTPLVATVAGGTITVYAKDTWSFTLTSSLLTLATYEAVAFAVKRTGADADADSLLYVRSDVGLVVLNGEAATAGNGTLTIDSATAFSVKIAIVATGVTGGHHTWWLKGFDTTPVTDEGYTLATGSFIINRAGIQATS